MANNLAETIKHIPKKPGVYLFKNDAGEILYVGKAINLKSRVGSYFTDTHSDRPWIKVMMNFVADVETIVVNNELESLMLESTLIKQHLPRFNIKLTDDKAYPYIKLSLNEPVARFSVVRRQTSDKASYFGPYLSARSALNTLEFLRTVYGIHISNRPLTANHQRPCFNCQLGNHPCVLAGEISAERYQEKIDLAVDFLQGKRKQLFIDVEERMELASAQEQFELAAKLRDQLHAMHHVTTHQQVVSTSLDDYDVIGLCRGTDISSVAVLHIRDGRVTGQRHFFLSLGADHDDASVIRQFLVSIYRNTTFFPPLLAIPLDISDQTIIEQWFSQLANRTVELRVPQRGEKVDLINLATKNAQSQLESRMLKTDHAYAGVIALQELLELSELPQRIEAVDISNLGSSETVGATVCFINGQPDKNEYRRYKIKSVEGQNDFAMIREVTARRFSDTSRPVPDLYVVDGGKEQLKFALAALAQTPMQPKQIISLAKKPDRIFLPGRKMPIPAPRGNKGLLLLGRIRDEVHRFGITYQRHRQRRKSLEQ